ncbi:5-formyltetrahydrofolate cyclo-ligase [Bradyrhizobium sp. 2TAF24]|uniref:5-formyltetrahydrofolate cyclo-ligase n=1 Tax=Bradyrhizobium sp. 2TAF24 TaxID=3233011 RepID=UPI003F92B8A0
MDSAEMDSADHAKVELRQVVLARRDALPSTLRVAAAQALAVRPLPFNVAPGQVVAGYMPIRSEFDPQPLMRALAARGARLVLPVVVTRDAPLLFRRWQPGDTLVRGGLGILEPAADAPLSDPHIVLVPLAAFDRAGHRIGYGAGHYDRTLARLRGQGGAPVTIGLAFAAQQVEHVPALPHDVPLDYIATEHETIETRRH